MSRIHSTKTSSSITRSIKGQRGSSTSVNVDGEDKWSDSANSSDGDDTDNKPSRSDSRTVSNTTSGKHKSKISTSSIKSKKKTASKKSINTSSISSYNDKTTTTLGVENGPKLLFTNHHQECISLFSPDSSYKQLVSVLSRTYNITGSNTELTNESVKGIAVLVIGANRQPFTSNECDVIHSYLSNGGSILCFCGEGAYDTGSEKIDDFTHINTITQQYGIHVNNDHVVRTVYHKEYYHPKEVLIKHASLVSSFDEYVQQHKKNGGSVSIAQMQEEIDDDSNRLAIAYPYGCTLSLSSPALPLITSGTLCFPANRCLSAYSHINNHGTTGRLCVMGSFHSFDDTYINKVDNILLLSATLDLLLGRLPIPDRVDLDRPEYAPVTSLPDTQKLAESLRSCLQEPEELPLDFTTLFDMKLFKYDTNLIPETMTLYQQLHVQHTPLSLIAPQFETPLPAFIPAIFPPTMRELSEPPLELFDLDEQFSSPMVRVAQLTNKSTAKELPHYICEMGDILGISDQVKAETKQQPTQAGNEKDGTKKVEVTANQVLEFVMNRLMEYKKLEQYRQPISRINADLDSDVLQLDSSLNMTANSIVETTE